MTAAADGRRPGTVRRTAGPDVMAGAASVASSGETAIVDTVESAAVVVGKPSSPPGYWRPLRLQARGLIHC